MPFEITTSGLVIQTLDEIKEELEDDVRAELGLGIGVEFDEVIGQFIGVMAEREAHIQQVALDLYSAYNPQSATGVNLDIVGAHADIERKDATFSESANGKIVGTPAVIVTDGSQVRLVQKQELWEVFGGPYVIPGGGELSGVSIRAVETGPKTFVATPPVDTDPNGWSIETPIANWDTFESEFDIDPEDIGSDIESDEEYRIRRKEELFINGNDLSAMKAAVLALDGVTLARPYDNPDCLNTVDGIPGGAFMMVVEGGAEADIVRAMFDHRPPGAESYGVDYNELLSDGEGGTVNIGLTRPVDVPLFIQITYDTANTEALFPSNGEDLIETAFLAEANARVVLGADFVPQAYEGVCFEAVRDDESGLDTVSTISIGVALSLPGPYLTGVHAIDIIERADYDSTQTTVVPV